MSSTKSIWNSPLLKKAPKEKEIKEKVVPIEKELTEEVKEIMDSKKKFEALKDTEYYICVVFSTKEDKEKFMQNVRLEKGDTFVDGYELAQNINIEPKRPNIKLSKPFDKKYSIK